MIDLRTFLDEYSAAYPNGVIRIDREVDAFEPSR
jgi:hypothetical protein